VWGEQLDGLNDEEYEALPPYGTENFIVFGECGFFSTTDSMYMKASTSRDRCPYGPGAPRLWKGWARDFTPAHSRTASPTSPAH
jgi:hypothetical protein